MDIFTDAANWVALGTLLLLEIVLGIDNVVFISILAGKLPPEQRSRGRIVGLSLALITRILLLLTITWIMRLTAPLFTVFGREFSGRDLILIAGGLFLIAKSTREMHGRLEGEEHQGETRSRVSSAACAGLSSISENTWPKPPMPTPTTAIASRPKARRPTMTPTTIVVVRAAR